MAIEIVETPVLVSSLQELAECLCANSIDLTQWGTDGAKVKKLFGELLEGETQLVKDTQGLIRQIMPSGVRVYHCPVDGTALYLREVYQEDLASKVKKTRQRDYSVGEKAKPGENHLQAAVRGVREELQIEGNFAIVPAEKNVRLEESPTFPGLRTRYDDQKFTAILNALQYRIDGYEELRAGKKNVFRWESAPLAESVQEKD